tara:strand:- start:588 stop:1658 length:1071 start_codon:yes stop_codon:yes gene_type:complete
MAFITLAGKIRDPNSDLSIGDQIRFTQQSTTGETLPGAVSVITISVLGTYSVNLQYGLVLVEYRSAKNPNFRSLGIKTVNSNNPATSIPELLTATVPVSSADLIAFQAILADAVTAKNAAVTAETGAVAALDAIPTYGTAATQDVTTNKQDTTEGRLLKVGDYGLGLIGLSLQSTDLDAFVLGGTASFYTNTTTNTPVAGTYGVQWYSALSTESGGAMAVSTSNQSAYFRTRNSSSFNPWYEFYHSNNTNFNVFGGLASYDDVVAVGVAASATLAVFYLPISGITFPSSITATALGFAIRRPSHGVDLFNNVSVTMASSSSNKLCVLHVTGLSGLTAFDALELKTELTANKITVNF